MDLLLMDKIVILFLSLKFQCTLKIFHDVFLVLFLSFSEYYPSFSSLPSYHIINIIPPPQANFAILTSCKLKKVHCTGKLKVDNERGNVDRCDYYIDNHINYLYNYFIMWTYERVCFYECLLFY